MVSCAEANDFGNCCKKSPGLAKGDKIPFRMGPTESIIIMVIVMTAFGVGKLPQVGGSIGKAIREFRKAQAEDLNVVDTEEKRLVSDDHE